MLLSFKLAVDAIDHGLLALILLLQGAQFSELRTRCDNMAVKVSGVLQQRIDREFEDEEQHEHSPCPADEQAFARLQILPKIHELPPGVLEVLMVSLKEILLPTSVLVFVIFTVGKNGDASSAFFNLTTSLYVSVVPPRSVTPVVIARLSTFRVMEGGVRALISCKICKPDSCAPVIPPKAFRRSSISRIFSRSCTAGWTMRTSGRVARKILVISSCNWA